MDLRNCPRCGRLFSYIGREICGSCLDKEDEEFKLVKEYIYDNPNSTVVEVSQGTGVPIDRIMRFLREERLEISSEQSNLLLECERCHKPIRSGRFCEQCKGELQSSFKKEFGIDKKAGGMGINSGKTDKDKMFTIKRIKGDRN